MSDNTQKNELTRKRLLWRATHRGIKEMDIIVGGFAKANLDAMDEKRLAEFEILLEIPDQDLLAWATGQADFPLDLNSALLLEMIAFRPVMK